MIVIKANQDKLVYFEFIVDYSLIYGFVYSVC